MRSFRQWQMLIAPRMPSAVCCAVDGRGIAVAVAVDIGSDKRRRPLQPIKVVRSAGLMGYPRTGEVRMRAAGVNVAVWVMVLLAMAVPASAQPRAIYQQSQYKGQE